MIKKFLALVILFSLLAAAGFGYWATRPIFASGQKIEFTIAPGSTLKGTVRQMRQAGVPVNFWLMTALAELSGNSTRLKAGTYDLEPGTSPFRLLQELVHGEFAQAVLVVIEGWTFHQMRAAVDADPWLRHDTAGLSDQELMEKVAGDARPPEGLFYPDTYLFAKNATSDLQIYRQAYSLMAKRLAAAWAARDPSVPYADPYQALIMASIVEKETGSKADRPQISGVFVNRLKAGMLLQTDPTVIYGMGDRYKGNISRRDLQTDTAYNTYLRPGLPPTPISLPGAASLYAALHPAKTNALYFVSRGDGSSQFSATLNEHNNAVNKYQRPH